MNFILVFWGFFFGSARLIKIGTPYVFFVVRTADEL